MSLDVFEKFVSPTPNLRAKNSSAELLYGVVGTSNVEEAEAAVLAEAPETYRGLVRSGLKPKRTGPLIFDFSVDYGDPDKEKNQERPETGDSDFTFDTTGGTQTLTTTPLFQTGYAPPGQIPPDVQGAIGVSSQGVAGVEIITPKFAFTERHFLAPELVTWTYVQDLELLTGRVCDGPFRVYDEGEVLFHGARGSKRGRGDWEIEYFFEVSRRELNVEIGEITIPVKEGWEYLWVLYEDAEDAVAKRLTKQPVAAYVAQVFEFGTFSKMGLSEPELSA